MKRFIIGIDPGNKESAYVLVDNDLRPISFCKMENELMYDHMIEHLVDTLKGMDQAEETHLLFAIEMIASYGMAVGAEIFDTCRWIGTLEERLRAHEVLLVFRREEKLHICHDPRANDANIRVALIDRFAPDTPNKGKGTKKAPGWFYGFHADIWQAYAVAVTADEIKRGIQA